MPRTRPEGDGAMMPRPATTATPSQSKGGGGGSKKKPSSNNKRSQRPFESSFPLGSLPAPRRAAPSLHSSDPLKQPLLNGKNGPPKGVGGVVYRSAESTQRTLNELARRRHERMEKRRAAALLAVLGVLAIVIHFASREPPDPSLAAGKGGVRGSNGENGGDAAAAALAGLNGTGFSAMMEENDDELEDDGNGREYDDEPAVERDIPEEKKAYLEPLRYFEDVRDPLRRTDVPFFFHIPRSGGTTFKDIAGQCLGKVLASEVGVRDGHGLDPTLAVVDIEGNRYVNVDTTTTSGLIRATELGLATSGLSDLVTSSYMKEAGTLFDLQHQGRAFTVLRNPIERAVSMYYFRTRGEKADLDPDLSLEAFAQGEGIENNWMTRFLIDRMEGKLTKQDLEKAKEVLEAKFLIGLLDDGKETFERIMNYYGWQYAPDETDQMKQEDCIDMLLRDGTNSGPEEYTLPKKGTQPYALISWQTQFDMKLYEFAKELFEKQTKQWGTRERKKELKKKRKKEKMG